MWYGGNDFESRYIERQNQIRTIHIIYTRIKEQGLKFRYNKIYQYLRHVKGLCRHSCSHINKYRLAAMIMHYHLSDGQIQENYRESDDY